MAPEQWLLYLVGILVAAIGAVFAWFRLSYWPHRMNLEQQAQAARYELEKKKEEAADKQRQHEWDMQKREADERERERAHEREVAKLKAASEDTEGQNLWKQVVEMQSSLRQRDDNWSEFVISLATDRADTASNRAREDAVKIAESYKEMGVTIAKSNEAVAHQLKEIRTSISVLVQDAVSREEERKFLRQIPETLISLLSQQQDHYAVVYNLLEKLNARFSNDI